MLFDLCILKDKRTAGFGPVKLFENKSAAIRTLGQMLKQQGFETIADELSLTCIGQYDSDKGCLTDSFDNYVIKGDEIDLITFTLKGN